MLDSFTVREGLDAGIRRGALYGPGFARPFRGVRSYTPIDDDHMAKCRAYARLGRSTQIFSHHSAAVLHGLPLPLHQHPTDVHVAVFSPEKPPQMRGVVAHELQPAGHRIVQAEGLRCFSAEDAWAQLSGSLSLSDLVVIGDWLITGDEPYSGTPSPFGRADLERALRHHGRRPGIRRLREALDLVRFGSLSPQETRLRLELMSAGLPEPALNYRIQHVGRHVAMVDLAYPDRRLAIEYLGDHHRTDTETYREDIHRRERLSAAGWTAVFLTADDLRGPVPRAILTVRRALHAISS